jgi:hypothetical protein
MTLCTEPPKPRKSQGGGARLDTATGQPLFQVGVCVIQERTSDVVAVTVAGEPKGLVPGQAVSVRGLVAIPWEQQDPVTGQWRHGIAFRAEAILPGTGGGAAHAASSGKAGG